MKNKLKIRDSWMPEGMVMVFVAPKFVVPLSLSGCEHQWEGPPKPPKEKSFSEELLEHSSCQGRELSLICFPTGAIPAELWLMLDDAFMSLPIDRERCICNYPSNSKVI